MLISMCARPGTPGVATATWGDERCVVAKLGVAASCWLELADVVVSAPRPSWPDARDHVLAVAARLPGCLIVAVRAQEACCVAVSDLVLQLPVTTCVALTAVWCYSRLVMPPDRGGRGLQRSAIRRSTRFACGRPDAR